MEITESRKNRDWVDLKKVLSWYNSHEPFDTDEEHLKCFSAGLTDIDNVLNCDTADEVGSKIHQKIDNKNFSDITLKRADQVKTSQELNKPIKVGDNLIHINSNT